MATKMADDLLQLTTFKIGDEEFGVDILRVREIIRMVPVTKVPRAPGFITGVINLRGTVLPVVSLRRRFGREAKADDSQTRIVLVELQKLVVGFVVDAVLEVLRIPTDIVEPTPPVVAGVEAEYISGMAKLDNRLLLLLDLDKLLSEEELARLLDL